jgi:hypothetical protein
MSDITIQGQSKVGYVMAMHGKQFNISVTNASATEMLKSNATTNFQGNSLIISSPTTSSWFDKGTPSMLVTDNDGKLLRLTYAIKPGNGLIFDTNNDTLSIGIDKHTINTRIDGKLYVDASNLICKTDTLETQTYNDVDYIKVKTSGIVDNLSVKSFPKYLPNLQYNFDTTNYANDYPNYSDALYVNNSFLVDNHFLTTLIVEDENLKTKILNETNSNTSLIIDEMGDLYGSYCTKLSVNLPNIIDNNTIVYTAVSKKFDKPNHKYYSYSDGKYSQIYNYNVLSVDTQKLEKASNNYYGIVKGNTNGENSISISNGELTVNTQLLTKGTKSNYGVVKVDNNTIESNNGTIKVQTQNLDIASSNKLGVVKCSDNTISVNAAGVIKVETQNLTKGTNIQYGVVKVDNNTIKSNNGTLSVETQNLDKISNTQYGVVKNDGDTIISENGVIKVNDYLIDLVYKNKSDISLIKTQILQLQQQIEELSNGLYIGNTTINAISYYHTAFMTGNKIEETYDYPLMRCSFITSSNNLAQDYRNVTGKIAVIELCSGGQVVNEAIQAYYTLSITDDNTSFSDTTPSESNNLIHNIKLIVNGNKYSTSDTFNLGNNSTIELNFDHYIYSRKELNYLSLGSSYNSYNGANEPMYESDSIAINRIFDLEHSIIITIYNAVNNNILGVFDVSIKMLNAVFAANFSKYTL